MPKVTLTQFVDYLLLSGPPKLRKVREIKTSPTYQPAFDFYKGVREGIVKFHKNEETDTDLLDGIAHGCHPTKKAKYLAAVGGHKRFLGRKTITWFEPTREEWVYDELRVVVNPELGLEFNDHRYLIKLYFKDEEIRKSQVGSVLGLMDISLTDSCDDGTIMSILDVRRSKLFTLKPGAQDLTSLLQAEAKAFNILWDGIK